MRNCAENRTARKEWTAGRRRKAETSLPSGLCLLSLLCLLWNSCPGAFAASAAPVAAAAPSPDMLLVEQESKFQREKTEYLQENVLDKILGPGKAVVIVDVEMGLESRAMEMGMEKKKSDKKKNEGENGEPQPAPQAKVLVPGVPMPKSPFQQEEDRGGQTQESGGQMQQKRMEVRT